MPDEEKWLLYHQDRLVARIAVTGGDFPWLHGLLEELPGYEAAAPLFAAEQRGLEERDHEMIVAAQRAIDEQIRLAYPDGSPVAEFWLQITGDGRCAWRWSDEPFDGD